MVRRIRWRWMLLTFLALAWGISDAAAAGPLPFQKIYERPGTANAQFYAVQGPLADGSFLLAGDGFIGEAEREELLVARMDQQGRFLWGRAIGNQIPGGPWDDQEARIVSTTDGGLVVIGLSSSGYGRSRLIGARLDGQGNVQWVRFYVNHGGGIGSIARAPDGSFIVALYESYDNNLIVGRLAGDGTVSWSRIYSPPIGWRVIDVAAIVAAPAGGFLVVGTIWNTDDTRDRDIFAVRLDGQGGVLWSKRYGNQPDISNEPKAVVSTPDGGFLIAGVTGRLYFLYRKGPTCFGLTPRATCCGPGLMPPPPRRSRMSMKALSLGASYGWRMADL